MKKLLFSILLSALVLSSCQIDEEENLLFNLKDNLGVSGIWQVGGSTNRFTFAVDGTFTFKNSLGTSSGTYTYGQITSSSIWDSDKSVGEFRLRFSNGGTPNPKVREAPNGDLSFVYKGETYTQIG